MRGSETAHRAAPGENPSPEHALREPPHTPAPPPPPAPPVVDGVPVAHPSRPAAPPARPLGVTILYLGFRIALGVIILAVGIVIAGALIATRKPPAHAPIDEIVRRVRVVTAAPQPAERVGRAWEGFGTARAMDQAEIASEVTARVVIRPPHIHPGVAVSAGELLLKLEESDFRERMQAAQRAAEAIQAQIEGLDIEQERLREQVVQAAEQARLARWELEQIQTARARDAAREIELVRAQSSLARAEGERLRLQQFLDLIPSRLAALRADLAGRRNEAEVAQRQLQRTAITAPFDGVVQSITRYEGEIVSAGERIARVVDVGRIEIPVRVPASAAGGIRVGDEATVRAGGATGYGARSWVARVARIAPEADPQTRTLTVFLELQQEAPPPGSEAWAELLMPGRFVTAQLAGRAGNGEGLILVPRRAVTDDTVWVVRRDAQGRDAAQPTRVRVLFHVEARHPELDPDETQWAVIGAGLNPGDRIITTNLDELIPGVRVEVLSPSAPTQPTG